MKLKNKTAVECLVEQVFGENTNYYLQWKLEIEQAKEIEKEQIMNAYQTSHISMMTAEQYYNETFKQKQNGSNTNK
jgi:hypothetical protein